MNLLVVSSWFPYPPDNGSRMRAYKLLQQLSCRHRVTLLALGSPALVEQTGPLQDLCQHVEVVSTSPERTHLGLLAFFSSTPRHLVQTRNATMEAIIAAQIRGKDLAIALQLDAARYLMPCTGLPRIFEEVEVAVLREQYLDEPHPLRRARHAMTWWKFQRYIRHLVHHFDAVTVVSDIEREHLRGIGCDLERIAVLPNGVDVPSRSPSFNKTRVARLIYPGSVTYAANHDAVRFFIREILPLVHHSRPDLEFWVTGSTEGVDIEALRRPGVVFTGPLPEVETLIAESAACVVPLRIGGGTRLKVLQSMALMTPVISTSKGVEGLEVETEHDVVIANTPPAFAAEVVRLCSNPSIGERLATNALQQVRERYTWARVGESLERLLVSAVARHSVRETSRTCWNIAAV